MSLLLLQVQNVSICILVSYNKVPHLSWKSPRSYGPSRRSNSAVTEQWIKDDKLALQLIYICNTS